MADSNRNKCRVSKVKIAKGEMKFCWRTGADSWASCSMDALPSTVVPRTIGADHSFEPAAVSGLSELQPAERARALAALSLPNSPIDPNTAAAGSTRKHANGGGEAGKRNSATDGSYGTSEAARRGDGAEKCAPNDDGSKSKKAKSGAVSE